MKDIFFLTSVIYPGKVPFNYSSVRSIYTPEQRFEQTLNGIQTIRSRMPYAEILIVECSPLSEEQEILLRSKVDYFINLYEDTEMRKACLESDKKGLGECLQTKAVLDYLINKNIPFDRLFKLSGRYFLSDHFHQENFSMERFTFKRRLEVNNGDIVYSTILYSVPFCLFFAFYKAVSQAIENYKNGAWKGIEEVLPVLCEPKDEIEMTGGSGYIGVTENALVHA